MALSAELNNLKSAGTYRFERDLSTISNDTTSYSNLRLVVGFSKQGPFNTPMLITNQAQFIKLYGNIDRSLEKRGSFFHRSALVALTAGPILALNLLNPDQDMDQVPQKSFAINTKETNRNMFTLPLASLYNTDKFWFPSDECYLDALDKYVEDNDAKSLLFDTEEKLSENILNFANVGKKPISILVKKASSYATTNYECTVKDWYGEGEVPEFLNPTSYVSDYMVEVYVVSGDFGPAMVKSAGIHLDDDETDEVLYRYDEAEDPYARFTSDVVYQSYFDKNGFIRKDNDTDTTDTKLAKFLNLSSVNLVAKYVGSLIPNFVDKFGRNIWIQKLVNDDTTSTGLLCAENVALIEDVDVDAEIIDEKIDIIGNNIHAAYEAANGDIDLNYLSYKCKIDAQEQSIVIIDPVTETEVTYVRDEDKDAAATVGFVPCPFAWTNDNDDTIYTAESNYTTGNQTAKKYAYSDYNVTENTTAYKFVKINNYNPLFVDITCANTLGDGESEPGKITYIAYSSNTGESDTPEVKTFKISELYTGANKQTATKIYAEGEDIRTNEIIVPLTCDIVAGDYLLSSYVESDDEDSPAKPYSRLTRVVEVRGAYADVDGGSKYKKVALRVICADVVFVSELGFTKKFKTIDQFCDRLQWVCLKGFKMRDELMPNGTNERQNEILDMLRENPEYTGTKSNLYKTLCDRDYIQWRYLVDSFGLGLEESCKDVYTLLCEGRQSAFALVNCPSQLDFKKSIDPSFTNERGSVEAQYIAEGANLAKTPGFLFSLPKYDGGASWGAYFYPYLKISDLSASKSVPPAAYVSNLYLAKYGAGNAWSIVAGQRRGVISGNQVIGVEATLIHDNRDWLEPVGINSIIWENGVGVEIYANKTAKQTPKSALSSAHVRECCIYIQDNIESILRKYVFEMNTAQVRLEIKTLVDNFLEGVKSDGGVYEYKTVMDTSNNTQEVIDNNMGIIDIYIEPVRGLEILTQRLTVMKTGGIAAGAFE